MLHQTPLLTQLLSLHTRSPYTLLFHGFWRKLSLCFFFGACDIGPSGEGTYSYLCPKHRGCNTFLSLPWVISTKCYFKFPACLLGLTYYIHPIIYHAPIILKHLQFSVDTILTISCLYVCIFAPFPEILSPLAIWQTSSRPSKVPSFWSTHSVDCELPKGQKEWFIDLYLHSLISSLYLLLWVFIKTYNEICRIAFLTNRCSINGSYCYYYYLTTSKTPTIISATYSAESRCSLNMCQLSKWRVDEEG